MQKGVLIIISLICSAFGIIGCQPTSDNTTDAFRSETEQSVLSLEINESFEDSDEISSNGHLSEASVDTSDNSEIETEQSSDSSENNVSDEESESVSSPEDNSDLLVSVPDEDDDIGGGIVLPEVPFD